MIFALPPTGYSFKPSKTPHVYLTCHKGRERDYGIDTIRNIAHLVPEVTFHVYGVEGDDLKNVLYHGVVPESQYNEEILNYQAGLRMNAFDGASEVMTKSILLGQYPIAHIHHPHIDCFSNKEELLRLLKALGNKNEVNRSNSEWWRNELEYSLNKLLA